MNFTVNVYHHVVPATPDSSLSRLESVILSLTSLENTMTVNVQGLIDQITTLTSATTGFKAVSDHILEEGQALLAQAQTQVAALIAANDASDQAAIDTAVQSLAATVQANADLLTTVGTNQQALIDAAVANTPAAPAPVA